MTWPHFAAFSLGLAALVALTVYAGAGGVLHTLEALSWTGLLAISLIHLPVVALMGAAWWWVGSNIDGASLGKFTAARFVRDAAAEVLPFSQVGGFVLGTRALHLRGVNALAGALSMSVDLVVELWAKLPYFVAGLLVVLTYIPQAPLLRTLSIALALTVLLVAAPLFLRSRLSGWMRVQASALLRRWPRLGTDADIERYFRLLLARRGPILAAFLVHLLCWFLGAAEAWVVFMLMGRPVSPFEALAIDSLVSGLRSFGFLVPAAAGVQEASYVVVCALFSVSPATAVALSLARRARDLLIGAPVLALWQIGEAHNLRAADDPP